MSHLVQSSKIIPLNKIKNKLKTVSKLKWCESGAYLYIKKLNYCIIPDNETFYIFYEELECFNSASIQEISSYVNNVLDERG